MSENETGGLAGEDLSKAWGEYPNTILHFQTLPPLSVDLRRPPDPDLSARLGALGIERSFWVLTAQNPGGNHCSRQENDTLAVNLQRALDEAGIFYVVVNACSPDGLHCELSVAVSRPRTQVVEMARAYEQLAVFWFDGQRFWIIPAIGDGPELPLPGSGASSRNSV